MESEAIQLIYSLLGSSPVAIILVYYLGRVDNRINILEEQIKQIKEVQNVCRNFRKI